jgi:hypothetical protein
MIIRTILRICLGGFAFLAALAPIRGQATQSSAPPTAVASSEELAKETQNPVASLISVPFQNSSNFNMGPFARDGNTLNIQPVIPMRISEGWSAIFRVILPLPFQPDLNTADSVNAQQHLGTWGVGEIQPTVFFSPAPGKIIWGAGPALLIPTASDPVLGTGKLSIGPSVVALVQPGKFTIGALVNNLWSVAGPSSRPDVNMMNLQYFVSYNLPKGWSLTSAPGISAVWNATSGNRWTVPFGGGFGRVFRIGAQPMSASVQVYYNAVRPNSIPSPTWNLKLQVALLFPSGPPKK